MVQTTASVSGAMDNRDHSSSGGPKDAEEKSFLMSEGTQEPLSLLTAGW